MTFRRILALCLFLVLLTGLFAGCWTDPAPGAPVISSQTTTAPATETRPPEPDWAARYAEAAAALEKAPASTVKLQITEDRTVGGDTVTETVRRTIRCQGRGTSAPVYQVSDLITNGLSKAACELTWAGGVLYAKVKEARYYSRQTEQDFLDTHFPTILLNPENYGGLSGEGDRVSFTEPLRGERWAMPEDGVLQSASASAVLTDGGISAVDYELDYRCGGSEIHTVYHAEIVPAVEEDLATLLPADVKAYESVESVEAAVLILRSRLALENATVASTENYGNAYAAAAGCLLIYTDETHNHGTGADLRYRQELNHVYLNLQDNSTETAGYQASYADGKYTEQWDDEEPEITDLLELGYEAEEIGDEYLKNRQAELLRLYPNYNELTDASLTDVGDYWLVEFSATEDFGKTLGEELNVKLFGEADKLDSYATKRVLNTAGGCLAVEKYTWLPTALSVDFEASYTIYGRPSKAQLSLSSAIRLYDPDTYEAITEEPLPDLEPERKPTPVFYEVTGRDGEKLYLFGTIHVGDDRTAFLPKHIYDAFDAADALAVEFDTGDFTDRLEEDDELKEQVAASYLYTDGSTLKKHVDDELYKQAVSIMKVMGEYTSLSEQYRPFVWAQQIENFYLSQGRRLTGSKGVDQRLLSRAREQEKEILNVESGEFQIGLMAGYSDELQELLLSESVNHSRSEVLSGVDALYELWCEGDEARLREQVAAMSEEDRAALDPGELALYDEYHQKMELERNAHMLETAREYLDSGRTVFFAVGLAHLLGEGGLVDGLREAGYTVTPAR